MPWLACTHLPLRMPTAARLEHESAPPRPPEKGGQQSMSCFFHDGIALDPHHICIKIVEVKLLCLVARDIGGRGGGDIPASPSPALYNNIRHDKRHTNSERVEHNKSAPVYSFTTTVHRTRRTGRADEIRGLCNKP